ncbi:MAG: S8 family serine peptidase, partial [Candidatus Hodarchaeota archaeon]
MFYRETPNLGSYNTLIIKKYGSFPIIHIRFNNSMIKLNFLRQYHQEIYRIELNQVLKSSLSVISEANSISSSMSTEFKDSTCASSLHNLGIKGKGIKIGIIDTGVENHSGTFETRVKGRESFVSIKNGYSENIPDPEDNMGHGTNVASIAAGTTTGIAPEAEIYSAKVIEPNIKGAGGDKNEETTAGLLEAIDYLVNNSVDVINISLGQYHNLPNGLRDEVINYVSIIHNIVFSVSVGNSGTSYGDRGTLNNPSTALQCIATTASDIAGTEIANFASRGPKVDYSMKPDITAPGINMPGGQGTSYAAPIVTGASALLIDFLKSENRSYSASTIKAALLTGARTLGRPVWEEGAGFINITRSLEILNSTEEIGGTPDLVYLHPQKLPFDPFRILFNGSSVTFNLTVISSRKINTSIIISETLSNFVRTSSSCFIINNTTLVPINFIIPASTKSQHVSGFINISNALSMVEFEIRETDVQVLFDESFNRITKHGYPTIAYEIEGDTSSTVGMFSAFTQFLAYEHNYSVVPNVKGDLTLTELLKYDVLILANPFSNSTDKFMDWVVNPDPEYLSPSEITTEVISQFVAIGGGVLVLTASDDTYFNITGLNKFLEPFNLHVTSEFSGGICLSDIVNPQDFTTDISSFPFRGNFIQTKGYNTQIIAECNGNPTLASYEDPSGGRVLLFGSDLIFDNIGFSSYLYPEYKTENRILIFNSVTWLAEAKREYIESSRSIPEFPYPLIFLVLIISIV